MRSGIRPRAFELASPETNWAAAFASPVADNGPGVNPRDLPLQSFNASIAGDAARSSPGSGLGLSLVAAIAELHGLDCSASDNHPGLKVKLTTADQDEYARSAAYLKRRRRVRPRVCRRSPSLAQGFPDVAGSRRARPRKDGREPATGRHGREPSAASER